MEHELFIRRVFDAPRELVWQAWTDPVHIRQWWGPRELSCPACELDFRVGGVFSLHMRGPDGATYPCKGVYREIVAPERIVYAGEAVDGHACGGGLPPRSLVTVRFVEHAGKTTLTLHTRFESAASLDAAVNAGYSTSWAVTLERLADALANKP